MHLGRVTTCDFVEILRTDACPVNGQGIQLLECERARSYTLVIELEARAAVHVELEFVLSILDRGVEKPTICLLARLEQNGQPKKSPD